MMILKKNIKKIMIVTLFFIAATLFGSIMIVGDTIENYYATIDTTEELEVVLYPEVMKFSSTTNSDNSESFSLSLGNPNINTTDLAKLNDAEYVNGYNLEFHAAPMSQEVELIGEDATELAIVGISDVHNSELKNANITNDLNDGEVIISSELATLNELSVGDTVVMESVYGETIELTVAELYISDDQTNLNKVFTSVPTAHQFSGYDNSIVNNITIYIDDVNEFKKLRRDIYMQSTLDSSDYNLIINDATYTSIIQPLEQIQVNLVKYFVVSVILLVILIGYFIYLREKATNLIKITSKIKIFRISILLILIFVTSITITTIAINDIVISDINTIDSLINEFAIPVEQNIDVVFNFITLILITIFTVSTLYVLRNIKVSCEKKTQKKITKNL